MSDRLRESLEWWFAPRPEPLSMSRREALLVDHLAHAARRFLALCETGPDATAHHLDEIHLTEDDFTYATCSCGYRTVPVDEDIWVDELMAHAVRAALADYLTEEETK